MDAVGVNRLNFLLRIATASQQNLKRMVTAGEKWVTYDNVKRWLRQTNIFCYVFGGIDYQL